MTVMTRASAYELCSQAVLTLGGAPVSADDSSPEQRFLEHNYEWLKKWLLTIHPWAFATKRTEPSYSVGTSESGKNYYFTLPRDCLKPLKFKPRADFYTESDVIYAAERAAHFYYTKDMNEDEMPPFFRRTLVDFLVANLAPLMTASLSRTDFFTRKAEHSLRVAQKADGSYRDSRPVVRDSLLISARR